MPLRLVSPPSSLSFLTASRLLRFCPASSRPSSTHTSPATLPSARKHLARMQDAAARYDGWSKENLIRRIADLESRVSLPPKASSNVIDPNTASQAPLPSPSDAPAKKAKVRRELNVSDGPQRKIALRFTYDGASYSGLAAQNSVVTPLPTVEAVLWSALCEARLVDPEAGMEGAGWSRCGRTDKGVSAAGQVVALWVRSRKVDERPLRKAAEMVKNERWADMERRKALHEARKADPDAQKTEDDAKEEEDTHKHEVGGWAEHVKILQRAKATIIDDDPLSPELPYIISLNRLLPLTIRVQAWSPVRSNFSARFDCRYRHYKYLFTSGAPRSLFLETSSKAEASGAQENKPTSLPPSSLNLWAMREGASKFLGEHDFRNFCKLDGSKQVENFRRRVDGVSIERVDKGWPVRVGGKVVGEEDDDGTTTMPRMDREETYVLNLRGTAFLYHQVRHMVAILFLIGSNLEEPSVIDEMLNVRPGAAAYDRQWLMQAGFERDKEGRPRMLKGSTAMEKDGLTASESWNKPRLAATVAGASQGSSTLDGDDDGQGDALTAPGGRHYLPPHAEDLRVYETKPRYDMASDRPLILWDCGFRPRDVAWRGGAYDGPLPVPEAVLGAPQATREEQVVDVGVEEGEDDEERDIIKAKIKSSAGSCRPVARQPDLTSAARQHLVTSHAAWQRREIEAEMARHFLLAAPSATEGWARASNLYEDGARPAVLWSGKMGGAEEGEREDEGLLKSFQDVNLGSSRISQPRSPQASSHIILGNGHSKPSSTWRGMHTRPREEDVKSRNEKFAKSEGRKRKEERRRRRFEEAQRVDGEGEEEGEAEKGIVKDPN